MRNYDFNKVLDSRTFEFFGKAVIEKLENKRFEIFSEGKDSGIDLRNVENGFTTIVQVKKFKDFNVLLSQLKHIELPKVEALKPNRYILITSVDLSVGKKDKIKEVFGNHITNTSDIIGSEDLNALLEKPEFKPIEDEYYQLWINSTSTLIDFIKKGLNTDIYAYTKDELENIKQATNIYVKNETFKKALKVIEKNRCLLICGEPGVGKSILARNLCAYLLNKNKETEFIYLNKISDVAKLLSDDKSQVFFIDDFWGSKFADNLKGEQENILKRVIEIIHKSKDKILILTCREYILEQGYAQYPELEEFFDQYKLQLHIKDYSDLFKAQILFRHLQNSNLPIEAIYQIAYGYEWIIHNQNYSPRIIENYINYVSEKEIEPKNYVEDFISYLNHPSKLWEEVFCKQSEGAQLILILMLLSGESIVLENVKAYFNQYLDYDTKIQARKKDFMKYISQLENTLITTYQDEWSDSQKIFVRFKNSSIELYVYQYLTQNLEEYINGLIQGAPLINNLLYLTGSWNIISENRLAAWEYEGISINAKITNQIKDKIVQKLMHDFDRLGVYFEEEDEDEYSESRENYVHKLIWAIRIYKRTANETFRQWLQEKVMAVLQELEINPYFDYEDLFSIPGLVEDCISNEIYTEINVGKVIRNTFHAIRFSKQLLILDDFREKFPKEYSKFYEEYQTKIKSYVYNLTLDDVSFFLSDGFYEEIDQLRDWVIPKLFKEYGLKYPKEYMDSFYQMTGERLLADKRKTRKKDRDLTVSDESDYEKEYKEAEWKEEQEKQKIEEEKQKLFDCLYEDTIEEDDAEKFFKENIKIDELVEPLTKLFKNYDKNYIRAFMEDWDSLEILANLINAISYIPQNSKEFFEELIAYVKKENLAITDEMIHSLQEIAFETFKEGRNQIYKRELLEKLEEDCIEELEKVGLIYMSHHKYYLQTIYLHLYLALKEMLLRGASLEKIYKEWTEDEFNNLFNDICYTYADLDLPRFNTEFLIPQIKDVLQSIKSKNSGKEIQKLVKRYEIIMDLDVTVNPEDEYIVTGGELTPDCNLLALEYIGFDALGVVTEVGNMEEIRALSRQAYGEDNEVHVILADAVSNKESKKYRLMEVLGVIHYLESFCNYLKKCLEILEKDSNCDLRMTYST